MRPYFPATRSAWVRYQHFASPLFQACYTRNDVELAERAVKEAFCRDMRGAYPLDECLAMSLEHICRQIGLHRPLSFIEQVDENLRRVGIKPPRGSD